MPVVEPVDLEGVIAIVMGMLVILIPVAGVTARFALKPIAEAIARIREGQNSQQEIVMLQQRLALLEQQHQNTEAIVERLGEAQEFHRQLGSPRS